MQKGVCSAMVADTASAVEREPETGFKMGFYYGQSQPPPPDKEPGGCMEVLIISRAVFGILAVPLGIILGAILGLVLLFWLFSVHVLLGLLGIALVGAGVAYYARWERRRFGPGGR